MTLAELTEEQKIQLKQQIMCDQELYVSWGELAMADDLVSDDELEEVYGGTSFVPEDF